MAIVFSPSIAYTALLRMASGDPLNHNHTIPRPLPEGGQRNGRPVWEPPMLDYSENIGDEYDKQREAVLKHYKGDRVKTTKHMDCVDERNVMIKYLVRAQKEHEHAKNAEKDKEVLFWKQLSHELAVDFFDAVRDHGPMDIRVFKLPDGTWTVVDYPREIPKPSARTVEEEGSAASGQRSLEESEADDNSAHTTNLPSHTLIQPPTTASAATQTALQIPTPTAPSPNSEPASPTSPTFRCGCPCS